VLLVGNSASFAVAFCKPRDQTIDLGYSGTHTHYVTHRLYCFHFLLFALVYGRYQLLPLVEFCSFHGLSDCLQTLLETAQLNLILGD